jgi:predicted permease
MWRQLPCFFRNRRFDGDLSEEIREHPGEKTEELVRSGMRPEDARLDARREVGNALLAGERSQDVWGFQWVERFFEDLRYGLRQLRRNPGFAAVAVATLALGIGATTAIFTIVNAALLHPLPFRDADRLVTRWGTIPRFDYAGPMAICGRDYSAWRDQNHVFEGIGAFSAETATLTGAGEPVRLEGSQVTAGLLPLLGVRPFLGRTFQPGEDSPGNSHAVLLSNKLWRTRFGSNRSIVGKSITLDGELYSVAGVMPASFDFPNDAQFWTPVPLTPDCSDATLQLVARLKPGIGLALARSEVALIDAQLNRGQQGGNKSQLTLVPLSQAMGYQFRPQLLILIGAVGFLLLIACANVANLLLARGAARQHEIAVRNALGASRHRIIVQMLTETLLLAALGGALGLAFAAWGHHLLASSFAFLPDSIFSTGLAARIASLGVDRWVLGFALAVTFLTAIISGLAPAINVSKTKVGENLKESTRNLSARRGRLRDALVMAEVAISLVLLVGAGPLMRPLIRLMNVHPGFSTARVLTMSVELSETRYHTKTQMIAFEQQAIGRLHALSGVVWAGGAFGLPLAPVRIYGDITVAGQHRRTPPSHRLRSWSLGTTSGPSTFLLSEDVFFGPDDAEGAPRVAIVSQSLARRLWPHTSATGQGVNPGFSNSSWCRVVGVVRDVKMEGLGQQAPLALYLPYEQAPVPFLMRDLAFVVRTASSPMIMAASARRVVNTVDPDLPYLMLKPCSSLYTVQRPSRDQRSPRPEDQTGQTR